MNYKEKIILISNNLVGGMLNSLFFVYPYYFNFPSNVYYSLISISYIGSIISSAIFGNIRINEKNYINIAMIGVIGPLLSSLLLIYPNIYLLILSFFLFNITTSSTYFSFLLYYRDVSLNFYFNIYWTFGEIIPQISLIFLSLIYNIYIVFILLLLSTLIIIYRKLYLFLFSSAYELNLLKKIDKMFSIAENNIDKFGTLYPIFEGLIFPLNIKKLRIGYLELYNLFVLIGFSLVWASLVYSVNVFSLSTIFPFLLFINGLYTSILYKIYKREINFRNIKIGIFSRFFIGIIILLSLIFSLSKIYNAIILTVLFILAAFSWTMFQYFFDNYIILNYPQKFGNIYLFRNLGGAIGSLLLYYISVQYGLFLSFIILGISFLFLNYVLKNYNK
ncbi:MAG: hypothetical protein L7H07_02005 [Candidatus Nanopusillus sp.]|nr:hypothetical protein [Candidatus Nanopusillus sp.]